ncbi:ATP-binding protein [Spongiactinospora rosea]|uniref:ATP-binding protein n=1 Tax=Spongiactinospora rosea TaxID=2248750 RepID=A0A366M3M6_9ACTN|nr:ATP-binding protein [Spongiactinospora rosea]RBQ20370.1 ATP-binding protein [Spongiactinospora rosea]
MTAGLLFHDTESRTPARAALNRVIAVCGAVMRGAEALLAAAAGLLGALPPVSLAWLSSALLLNLLWTSAFVWAALRYGLRAWLVAGEIAVACALCLAQGRLLVPEVAMAGASWVAVLATMSILIAAMAWRPSAAVPGGLAVALAHLTGAQLAGFGGGVVTVGIHCVQIIAGVTLMTLLRRSADLADALLTRSREAAKADAVQRARRADERGQYSRVHDTVLNTLTTVGAGGVERTSPTLRGQAAADLRELERIARDAAPSGGPARLDERLAAVATEATPQVHTDLTPHTVPGHVAEAFAGACAEALTNVARHAGTGTAHLRLTDGDGRVLVEITDTGHGFDPASIPTDRYGLRGSITARMESVGGGARVESGAHGTRVLLWWSP